MSVVPGSLKKKNALVRGTGEGATLVPEQLHLQEVVGDGAAVDYHKWPVVTRALKVHRLCFFSRTRRHTTSTRDWSSDVCSSDLMPHLRLYEIVRIDPALDEHAFGAVGMRSEGRRVGKECRSRWSPYH